MAQAVSIEMPIASTKSAKKRKLKKVDAEVETEEKAEGEEEPEVASTLDLSSVLSKVRGILECPTVTASMMSWSSDSQPADICVEARSKFTSLLALPLTEVVSDNHLPVLKACLDVLTTHQDTATEFASVKEALPNIALVAEEFKEAKIFLHNFQVKEEEQKELLQALRDGEKALLAQQDEQQKMQARANEALENNKDLDSRIADAEALIILLKAQRKENVATAKQANEDVDRCKKELNVMGLKMEKDIHAYQDQSQWLATEGEKKEGQKVVALDFEQKWSVVVSQFGS